VDLVLITGYSGAGKSTALQFFEDAGYFCVDNIPPEMLRSLADLFMHEGSKVEAAAVVCDARGGAYFDSLVEVADDLRQAGVSLRVLFLEFDEQTLITRYRETRRRHPLATSGSVAEGIAAERALVAPLRDSADFVIDTTGLRSGHAPPPGRRGAAQADVQPAAVRFTSFGHKHGPLRDADVVLDVRFLPQPTTRPSCARSPASTTASSPTSTAEALDNFAEHLLRCSTTCCPSTSREGKATWWSASAARAAATARS
jgi:UPF0042 nucleotide-binding protein